MPNKASRETTSVDNGFNSILLCKSGAVCHRNKCSQFVTSAICLLVFTCFCLSFWNFSELYISLWKWWFTWSWTDPWANSEWGQLERFATKWRKQEWNRFAPVQMRNTRKSGFAKSGKVKFRLWVHWICANRGKVPPPLIIESFPEKEKKLAFNCDTSTNTHLVWNCRDLHESPLRKWHKSRILAATTWRFENSYETQPAKALKINVLTIG